jgi:hypothetical protein
LELLVLAVALAFVCGVFHDVVARSIADGRASQGIAFIARYFAWGLALPAVIAAAIILTAVLNGIGFFAAVGLAALATMAGVACLVSWIAVYLVHVQRARHAKGADGGGDDVRA